MLSLAEALEMDPPVMPDDGPTRVNSAVDGSSHGQGKDAPAMEPVWDDEDTRSFYESLPDLRLVYPIHLLEEISNLVNGFQLYILYYIPIFVHRDPCSNKLFSRTGIYA